MRNKIDKLHEDTRRDEKVDEKHDEANNSDEKVDVDIIDVETADVEGPIDEKAHTGRSRER